MWFMIAFCLSLILPDNGVCLSIWHGLFGRLYILYFIVRYHVELFAWWKSIVVMVGM